MFGEDKLSDYSMVESLLFYFKILPDH